MCTPKVPEAPKIVKADPPAPPPAPVAMAPQSPVINEATTNGDGTPFSARRGRKGMTIPLANRPAGSPTGINIPQ